MSSPRGKSAYSKNYEHICKSIQKLGHRNISNFINEVDVDKFYLTDIRDFYSSTISDLKNADICVFEVSVPSLAIGQLISIALQYNKPVIALYTGEKTPFFLSGVQDEKVQVCNYNANNLDEILDQAINFASESSDVRFNFFISPSIGNYLDWVSKVKKIPRSVYLRGLIEKDMEKNNEW